MCDHRGLRPIRLQDLYSVCSLAPLLVTVLQLPGCNKSIACYKNFSAVQDIQRKSDLLTGALPWTTHGLLLYHQVWPPATLATGRKGAAGSTFPGVQSCREHLLHRVSAPDPKVARGLAPGLALACLDGLICARGRLACQTRDSLPQLSQFAAARLVFNGTLFFPTTSGEGEKPRLRTCFPHAGMGVVNACQQMLCCLRHKDEAKRL